MKAILTIGVSASGKSTWAKNYAEKKKKEGENWIIIGQDEIRLSLIKQNKGDNIDEVAELKKWDYSATGQSEIKLQETWDHLVRQAIEDKHDGIIFSNTNLDGGAEKIARIINLGINPEDITTREFPISFEEALKRDSNRKFSVGEAVLKMQFTKLDNYLQHKQNSIKKPKI